MNTLPPLFCCLHPNPYWAGAPFPWLHSSRQGVCVCVCVCVGGCKSGGASARICRKHTACACVCSYALWEHRGREYWDAGCRQTALHTEMHTHTDRRWSTESFTGHQAEKWNTSQDQTSSRCPYSVLDPMNKEELKQQGGREAHPSTFCPLRRSRSQYVVLNASGDSQPGSTVWMGGQASTLCDVLNISLDCS